MLGSISGRVDPLLLTVVFNEHQVFNNDLSNLKKKSSGILPSGFFLLVFQLSLVLQLCHSRQLLSSQFQHYTKGSLHLLGKLQYSMVWFEVQAGVSCGRQGLLVTPAVFVLEGPGLAPSLGFCDHPTRRQSLVIKSVKSQLCYICNVICNIAYLYIAVVCTCKEVLDGECYLQIFREIEFSCYYHKLSGF